MTQCRAYFFAYIVYVESLHVDGSQSKKSVNAQNYKSTGAGKKMKQKRRSTEEQTFQLRTRQLYSTKRWTRGRRREGNKTKCTGAFYRGQAMWRSETRKCGTVIHGLGERPFSSPWGVLRYTTMHPEGCSPCFFFFSRYYGHFGNNTARTGLPNRTSHILHKVKQGNHQRVTHTIGVHSSSVTQF